MSVQLIVYPQSFEGQYNEISSSPTEFLVNGINFANLDSAPAYTSSTSPPYVDTLTNEPATIPNTWYRFRNNTGGTPNYPSLVSGSLILESVVGSGSLTGVYQRLTNLVIGQQYTITINLSVSTTGSIITQIANGTIIYSGGGGNANVTQITDTFTAQSTDSTVMIAYLNTIVGTATITDLSIQPVVGEIPSGATNFLDNGQIIVDLYEDEDLPLTLSVDDFKNVAEKVQSYSKAFNLPSTKRNNRIFDHIFEITREVASAGGLLFNPYKRTQCVLKQDGFILFEGYLRMLDIIDKEGEISYNVNLYSEVIALADTLKDRAFRDLDFTELEHAYNRTQITNSWNDSGTGITFTNPSTSGFRDANSTVKYPFVDWNHQIIVADNPSGAAAPTDGNPEYTSLEQIFRPFINIKYLIDRIFEASEFTYESSFFTEADFKKLYMDFNWGADNSPSTFNNTRKQQQEVSQIATSTFTIIEVNKINTPPYTSEMGYSAGVFTAQTNSQTYTMLYDISIGTTGFPWSLTHRWKWYHASTGNTDYINETPMTGTTQVTVTNPVSMSGNFTRILDVGDTLSFEFQSLDSPSTVIETSPQITPSNPFAGSSIFCTTSAIATTSDSILQTLRGELGQWDFLKGLITMFNLVTLVDEDNPDNIIIEPYSDVFIPTATAGNTLANRGIEHDWTDKIDVSEMKLEPLADLNKKTIFKFVEDDDDYSFNQYKNDVGGHLYGSQKYNAGNEFNILEGTKEIIAEPFAATVVKPLMSQFPQFVTPAIYARGSDATWEGFENSPRIMYNNGIKNTGASYYIPAQNGVGDSNEPNYLQFSHLKDSGLSISGARDFHFGECQLLVNQATTLNNLFNFYWLPYYSQLYNPNTRVMTIKVNLNASDINLFRFNDRIFLKNRIFRVNKIDYKPNDLSTVEFILIP